MPAAAAGAAGTASSAAATAGSSAQQAGEAARAAGGRVGLSHGCLLRAAPVPRRGDVSRSGWGDSLGSRVFFLKEWKRFHKSLGDH